MKPVVPGAAYDALLGADFLNDAAAIINLGENTLKLKSASTVEENMRVNIPLLPQLGSTKVRKAKSVYSLEVPARSETLLPCDVTDPSDRVMLNGVTGMMFRNDALMKNKGLLSASCVVVVRENVVPARVINLSRKPIKIHEGQTVCYLDLDEVVATASLDDKPGQYLIPPIRSPRLPSGIDLSKSDTDAHQRAELRSLIIEYSDCFAETLSDLEQVKNYEFNIMTGSHPPIKRAPYRVNPVQRKIIKEQVEEWEKAGLVTRGESPWASPVCLALKKDGSHRLCIDYSRGLNVITKVNSAPLPNCEDLMNLAGDNKNKIFSGLDLKSGYQSVKMSDSAREKAAFVTTDGQYLVNQMAFGLVNSPSYFQSMMTEILQGLVPEYCLVYIDDIIVASRSFSEHLFTLEKILSRFREFHLKANPKKCLFCVTALPFLGHIITSDSIKPQPEKLEVISNFPCPADSKTPVKTLRSFLGICGYYRRFCKDFAKIAKPLYDLTKKNINFVWDGICQESFVVLKKMLVSAPCLIFPDFTKKFIIHTDASDHGLGAVLSQEIDGQERVINYAGRGLKGAEVRYAAHEKEMLGVLFALQCFESYLTGVPCDIVTDNRAVSFVLNAKSSANNRIQRWRMRLSCFPNVRLLHRSGKLNSNADAISRFPYDEIKLSDIPEVELDAVTTEGDLTAAQKKIAQSQMEDDILSLMMRYLLYEELPADRKLAEKVVLESPIHEIFAGVLCKIYHPKGRDSHQFVQQICVPKKLQYRILETVHKDLSAGGCHFSFDKFYASLLEYYTWKNMAQDAKEYSQNCPDCQARKGTLKKNVLLGSLPPVTRPLERVSIDFTGPLPPSGEQKYRHILVLTDAYSRFVDCYPTTDQKAITVAKCLFEYVTRYGTITYLLSDHGKCFTAEIIEHLCDLFDTKRLLTNPFHPQGNLTLQRILNQGLFCTYMLENRLSKWQRAPNLGN